MYCIAVGQMEVYDIPFTCGSSCFMCYLTVLYQLKRLGSTQLYVRMFIDGEASRMRKDDYSVS
jgi:hypothetical protein